MRPARFLCAVLLLSSPARLSAAQVTLAEDSIRVQRLAALAEVWGRVKYFHPALAMSPELDWDAALVAAIPRAIQAHTPEEYGAAVQLMLEVLNDPLTRVVGLTPESTRVPNSDDGLGHRWTGDSILIVTVRDYYSLYQSEARSELETLVALVPEARAVVFDLRSPQPVSGYGRFQLTSSFDDIERLLTTDTLARPGEWRRVYYGFESPSPFSSGQYRSGHFVEYSSLLVPDRNAREIPTIFVLNQHADLLTAALPLQAAGKALIVFEGDIRTHSIGETVTVELGDGLIAQIRESVPVFEDGRSGEFQPDVIVDPPADQPTDRALEVSLELARDFTPSDLQRRQVPASVTTVREASYGNMTYPDLAYRLLAAMRFWNAIEYFYPYKDLLDQDWKTTLIEVLPDFVQAADATEYAMAVARLATRVQDSHAYVGGALFNEQVIGEGFPPVRVRMIDSLPVVTALWDSTAAGRAGVRVGDVVVSVDGVDALDRVAYTAQFFSASTPQSRLDKATLSFMNGPVGSSVVLILRNRDGREKQAVLERRLEDYTTLYHRERSGEIVRILSGNVGYVDLDRLTYDMVDPMFETLADTRAIIFDMRGYPYGTIWAIAPRLTDTARVAARFETPLVGHRSPAPSTEAFLQVFEPASPSYGGQTVMLMDERTMSQAEHTGLWLKAANNTLLVGSQTAGADGEITSIALPGGLAVGFTGQSVTFPDGRQLQRRGLTPDVEVKPTLEGIRAGRDEVLDAALRLVVE